MSDTENANGLEYRIEELEAELHEVKNNVADLNEQQQQVLGMFEQVKQGKISRRTFMAAVTAMGGLGLGVGSVVGHTTSPGWDSATGTIGTDSTPLDRGFIRDLHFDEAHGGSVSVDETRTERIGSGTYHFAGDYSGGDPDTRLGNAISAASDGDVIFIEPLTYVSNRTIPKPLTFQGASQSKTVIDCDWTLGGSRSSVKNINIPSSGSINADAGQLSILNCFNSTSSVITVSADLFRYVGNRGANITFENGTSGGIVDACTGTSVTDNGTNTVGDIA